MVRLRHVLKAQGGMDDDQDEPETHCQRWGYPILEDVSMETRLSILAASAANLTKRLSCRVESGSTGSIPGNSQPPGNIFPLRWACCHQVRSNLSSEGASMALRSRCPAQPT